MYLCMAYFFFDDDEDDELEELPWLEELLRP
jgi:hypothetical protein